MNFFNQGLLFLQEGNAVEAEKCFSNSVLENPNNAEAWFHRGKANRLKGDMIAAMNDFYKTLDIEPSHREATQSIELIKNILSFRNPDLMNH